MLIRCLSSHWPLSYTLSDTTFPPRKILLGEIVERLMTLELVVKSRG